MPEPDPYAIVSRPTRPGAGPAPPAAPADPYAIVSRPRPPGPATIGEQLAAKEAARATAARRQGNEDWGAYLAETIANIPKDAIAQAGGLVNLLTTAAGATAELGDDIGNTVRDAVGLTPHYLTARPNQDALKALPGAVVEHYAKYLDPAQRALQVREHPVGLFMDLSPAAALRRGTPPAVPTGPAGPGLAARAGAATAGARTAASTAAATARSVAATPAGAAAVALGRTALDWTPVVGPAIRTAETAAAQLRRWAGVYRAWQEAAAQARASGAPVPPPPAPPPGVAPSAPGAPAGPAPPAGSPVAAPVAPSVAAAPPPVAEPLPAPVAPPVASPVGEAPPVAGPVPAPAAPPVAGPVAPPVAVPTPPAGGPAAAFAETVHQPWEGRTRGQQSPAWLANDLGLAARRARQTLTPAQFAEAGALVRTGGRTPAQAVAAVAGGGPAAGAAPAVAAPSRTRVSASEFRAYTQLRAAGKTDAEATAAVIAMRRLTPMTPDAMAAEIAARRGNASPRRP